MFERFTSPARDAVTGAQEQARALGYRWMGTEHLLLALAADPGAAGAVLREHGADVDVLRAALVDTTPTSAPLDADALRSLGIDLDDVRRRVEDTFGEGALDQAPPGRRGRFGRRGPGGGHLPFTPGAKMTLERALRETQRLGQRSVGAEELLLGVLDVEDSGVRLLTAVGADRASIRAALLDRLRRSA